MTKDGPRNTKTKDGKPLKILSFQLMDQAGDMIKITCFGDLATKYEFVQEKGVYVVSGGGALKKVEKEHNNGTGHDYEITLNKACDLIACPESTIVPEMKFNFVALVDLAAHLDEIVDVKGYVKEIEELTTVEANGRQLTKRGVTICDETGANVEITLWGERAEKFEAKIGALLKLKSALVREYNGKRYAVKLAKTFLGYYGLSTRAASIRI